MKTWLLWVMLSSLATAATVTPLDPNLQYIGRWDNSTPSQPWAQAQASSVTLSFTGTSIEATLNVVGGEYFRVIIDDDAAASQKVSFVSGVPLMLASGLAAGTHKLELIKETDVGRSTLVDLTIDDGEATVPSPPRPTRRIVFYGASRTSGFSAESERDLPGTNLFGTYYGFPGITSRMFGAEYHNISRSGATISTLNTSFDRIDWTTSSPLFNMSRFAADLVVVNIGANNVLLSKAVNKTFFHALLDDLRLCHPTSHIILFNAYGWDENEPANYIDEVIAERVDPNMSAAIFPWLFERFHGCETDNAGIAVALADHVTSVIGWTPAAPDVVSGYGRDGDVANGSFEAAAPFGGWGWRYFDDPGVSRIFDPVGSWSGDYFLRLDNGAGSHQTNPASDGDTIAMSMWMRGANGGDSVDVSIGFRDQNGGGEINPPMAQTSQNMTLSTSWELYTLSAVAPTGGPDPVYSASVAFVAGATDTVDIDRISRCGDVTTYGNGCAGSGGFVPTLSVSGCAVPGGTLTTEIANGLGGAQALVLLSTAPALLPIGGGCKLFIQSPFGIAGPISLGGSGNGNGSISFQSVVPTTTLSGTSGTLQAFVLDSGNPIGGAGTNGVEVVVR